LKKIWGHGERICIENKHSLRRRSWHMGFVEEGMGLGKKRSLKRNWAKEKMGPIRVCPREKVILGNWGEGFEWASGKKKTLGELE